MFLNIASEVLIVFAIDVCNISRPVVYRSIQRGGIDVKLK